MERKEQYLAPIIRYINLATESILAADSFPDRFDVPFKAKAHSFWEDKEDDDDDDEQ